MTQKIHIPPTYLKNFCFYMFCYTISIIFFIFKPFYLLFRFILYGVAFCIIVFQRLSIR